MICKSNRLFFRKKLTQNIIQFIFLHQCVNVYCNLKDVGSYKVKILLMTGHSRNLSNMKCSRLTSDPVVRVGNFEFEVLQFSFFKNTIFFPVKKT